MSQLNHTSSLSSRQQIVGLAGWFATCFAVSALGAIASVNAQSFYGQLQQPTWAPPGWVFGPVWTVLFAMMAVSAWLVWRRGGFRRHPVGLTLFGAQLIANALWSWLFFAWQLGALALADLVVLWVLIAATAAAFWSVSRLAATLLLPYLAWVSFAGALNVTLWQTNPSLLGA